MLKRIRGGCTLPKLQLLLAQNVNGHGIEILYCHDWQTSQLSYEVQLEIAVNFDKAAGASKRS